MTDPKKTREDAQERLDQLETSPLGRLINAVDKLSWDVGKEVKTALASYPPARMYRATWLGLRDRRERG